MTVQKLAARPWLHSLRREKGGIEVMDMFGHTILAHKRVTTVREVGRILGRCHG